jgi:hypothetical protein
MPRRSTFALATLAAMISSVRGQGGVWSQCKGVQKPNLLFELTAIRHTIPGGGIVGIFPDVSLSCSPIVVN